MRPTIKIDAVWVALDAAQGRGRRLGVITTPAIGGSHECRTFFSVDQAINDPIYVRNEIL